MRDMVILHENEYYYSIVRKNVKRYRLEKNLTQQELADMAGLSREYISDIENEKRKKHFTIEVIGRIADALGTEMFRLFEEP